MEKQENNLSIFLQKLSDTELAYFYHYRFKGFIEGSRERILDELQKRKLTTSKCKAITQQHPASDTENRCPRCGSDKYSIEKKEVYATDIMVGTFKVKDKYQYACQVCGFVDIGKRRFWLKLVKFIKGLFRKEVD